ncbi:beige/beach-related [Anaeramoeba flamelloides]|uniref:Beige/beach-related n=1 Tax=Anaeramoeba flamelloides TaxID=1746091 RepID=A0ABQ8Z5Y3_9EUKA|nr:beige/beach-related [Anaeramoeba flamelloides]
MNQENLHIFTKIKNWKSKLISLFDRNYLNKFQEKNILLNQQKQKYFEINLKENNNDDDGIIKYTNFEIENENENKNKNGKGRGKNKNNFNEKEIDQKIEEGKIVIENKNEFNNIKKKKGGNEEKIEKAIPKANNKIIDLSIIISKIIKKRNISFYNITSSINHGNENAKQNGKENFNVNKRERHNKGKREKKFEMIIEDEFQIINQIKKKRGGTVNRKGNEIRNRQSKELKILKISIMNYIINNLKIFSKLFKNSKNKSLIINNKKKIINQLDEIINNILLKKNDWFKIFENLKKIYQEYKLYKFQNIKKYFEEIENNLKMNDKLRKNIEKNNGFRNKKKTYLEKEMGQLTGTKNEMEEEKEKEKVKEIVGENDYFKIFEEEWKLINRKMETRIKINQNIWRKIFRGLSNEKGAWGKSNKERKIHFKISKNEDSLRRRKRIKINHDFKTYHNKNYQSLVGDFTEEKKPIKNYNESPLLKENFSVTSFNTLEELNDLSSDFDDNTDENDVDIDIGHGDENENKNKNKSMRSNSKNKKNENKTINNKNNTNSNNNTNNSNHKDNTKIKKLVIEKINAKLIFPLITIPGNFIITNKSLEFDVDYINLAKEQKMEMKEKKVKHRYIWPWEQIFSIYPRRHLLKYSAIELFMKNGKNYFINYQTSDRNRILKKIFSLKYTNFEINYIDPRKILKKYNYTQKWIDRKISNFEYLMRLNTIAGRSYNDISQYHVFPWILQDYTSKTIDLNDHKIYRDLSKPIGALNEKGLKKARTNFEFAKKELQIPPFLYGSHYSSGAVPLFFLIRLEPFTALSLRQQGGNFDHPDRLFFSIPNTWKNCLEGSGDFKELTPEFFYLPEFLINSNNFDFGKRQNDSKVNDVELPPWANGSPEEFIRIHRQALESEYVSEHLNEWIDLIFGYKQRGKEADKADNVFYYLTYEGAVDIDKISDPIKKKAIITQIEYFGQTPIQLFKKSHPKRKLLNNENKNNNNNLSSTKTYLPKEMQLNLKKLNFDFPFSIEASVSKQSIVFLSFLKLSKQYHFILIDNNRKLFRKLKIQLNNQKINILNNTIKKIEKNNNKNNSNNKNNTNNPNNNNANFNNKNNSNKISLNKKSLMISKDRIGPTFSIQIKNFQNCFAKTNDSKFLFASGFWTNSIYVISIKNSINLQTINKHNDLITCLAIDEKNEYLVSGSKDTTARIYKINLKEKKKTQIVKIASEIILYGHDDVINCVDVNTEFNLVVTGSDDHNLIIHNLFDGKYVMSIKNDCPVTLVKILYIHSKIILFSPKDRLIKIFTLNGKLLSQLNAELDIKYWVFSKDQSLLFAANGFGTIKIIQIETLSILKKESIGKKISSLAISENANVLLIGLNNGKVKVFTYSH